MRPTTKIFFSEFVFSYCVLLLILIFYRVPLFTARLCLTTGDAFTFICVYVHVYCYLFWFYFCTATYCYVLQLEMHACLICAIKFCSLYSLLTTHVARSPWSVCLCLAHQRILQKRTKRPRIRVAMLAERTVEAWVIGARRCRNAWTDREPICNAKAKGQTNRVLNGGFRYPRIPRILANNRQGKNTCFCLDVMSILVFCCFSVVRTRRCFCWPLQSVQHWVF